MSGSIFPQLDSGAAYGTPHGAATAANMSASQTGVKAAMVAGPGTWAVFHHPSTATQATITKAAGAAGVRHVCNAILATVSANGTAQTPLQLVLRDGASGAGTVLFSCSVSAPVTSTAVVALSNLHIVGSAATAMTLEFTGAGVAASQSDVSLAGYDVV